MAQIPNSVPLTGLITPTDDADTFPVIDPQYGIDGLRSVADAQARDAIAGPRRREGMLVFTRTDKKYWSLGPDLSNASWTEFKPGAELGTDPGGVGFKWCIQDNLVNESISVAAGRTFIHANTQLGPQGEIILGAGAELITL